MMWGLGFYNGEKTMTKTEKAKRVDLVRVVQVKEGSILYDKRQITHPQDAIDLANVFLEGSDREIVILCCLNSKNQPTHLSRISMGSLNASMIHPREVFKVAILSNAAAIILFHNHPSGCSEPSKEDIAVTQRLHKSGQLLGIELLDHLVLGDEGTFTSLKEEGYLIQGGDE